MADMSDARVNLTAELVGEMTVEVAFVASQIPEMLEAFDARPGRPTFPQMVEGLASSLVTAHARGEDMTIPLAGMLWSAMRHPDCGGNVCDGISRMLRESDYAHVTWRHSPAGLMIGVGRKHFQISEELAVALIAECPVCIEVTEPEVVTMQ